MKNLINKVRSKIAAVGVVGLSIAGATAAHADTGSSYVTSYTTAIQGIQADMLTILPIALGVAATLWGVRFLTRMFKSTAK
ncbi:hypothetical protein SAMN05444156_2450 [Verrucomicrobium sp. GAS474]|uniref:hypothetical protein n=1 Tax=Verrucomicrobium sp. GAS474 TaxID=1882831 RepID=UPI00087CA779|nr:hypothetical protein [Verrucomicrobium sp. GAS474]SDU18122.1 hypothetical protein SAMN05444156_2450 [Verrucomicrobium sp. GAS474]